MVKIYVRKIKANTMLWSDVPSLWQSKVVAKLKKEGYTCNEDGTVSLKEADNESTAAE